MTQPMIMGAMIGALIALPFAAIWLTVSWIPFVFFLALGAFFGACVLEEIFE